MTELNQGDALAQFLVDAPLYQTRRLPSVAMLEVGSNIRAVPTPRQVERWCAKCNAVLNWRTERSNFPIGAVSLVSFRCPNCEDTFGLWALVVDDGGVVVVTKYGQYPRMMLDAPKAVGDALGAYAEFWRSGMTLRSHGYGIGALVYFRRIVEGITSDLLERLAVAMEASGDPEGEVKAVRGLIQGKETFDVKVREAAKMIPRHLRPGGVNPLNTIFEIVSPGLHNQTDAECCDLVDALAESMTLLLATLNTHVESQKAYGAAVKNVEKLRGERRE